MSPQQFADWCEYYKLEPWGFPTEDLRAGIAASTTANAAGAKLSVKDFMLRPIDEPAADHLDQFKRAMGVLGIK